MAVEAEKTDIIARIMASFAARPDVGPDDIVYLYEKLVGGGGPETGKQAQPSVERAEPAVPVEQALTDDAVYCLCCGRGFKMLKRHLGAEHGLTEAEYRTMFGLPVDMPLVAPSYSMRKAAFARKAGLGKYDRRPGRVAAKS